ncbi:hypothetical protein OAN47_02645 [Planctomycetota bacterium]|nr:hypothetical protein [Planctomycetota bacterium]
MAKTDIMGLLTGVSSQGLDPMTALTPAQQRMEFGARRAKGLTGAVRGMLGGAPSIQEQLATGVLKKQLAEQQAMTDLDLRNPEDLIKLAKVQQASGDLKGAVSTLKTAQNLQQQAGLKEGLLKIARSQENREMIDFIEAGGSLQTASTKLLGDKTVKPKTYSLGSSDIKEYDLYFEDIDEDFLKTIGYDTPFIGKLDKTDKMKLFTKAEQLFANNLSLGREGALKQALALKASGGSMDGVPTTTTSGATPRGQQKDPYSSVKE